MATIEVEDVKKRYGRTEVLDAVSFTLRPGVTRKLGPHGADKTPHGAQAPDCLLVSVLDHHEYPADRQADERQS